MLRMLFKIIKLLVILFVIASISLFGYMKLTAEPVTLIARADGAQTPIVVFPKEEAKTKGLVIISHGAGGSEQDLHYLAKALNDEYYVVVAGHNEHETLAMIYYAIMKIDILNDKASIANDPKTYKSREMDLDAILNWAPEYTKKGRKILIGYSRGSRTAMMEAGAENMMNIQAKDRFDAYIALSPAGHGIMFPKDAWKNIKKPMLMLTGTMDDLGQPEGWQVRKEPFENMIGGCKWLGVIDGTSHINFMGLGYAATTKELTIKVTKEFLHNIEMKTCKKPNVDPRMKLEIKE